MKNGENSSAKATYQSCEGMPSGDRALRSGPDIMFAAFTKYVHLWSAELKPTGNLTLKKIVFKCDLGTITES